MLVLQRIKQFGDSTNHNRVALLARARDISLMCLFSAGKSKLIFHLMLAKLLSAALHLRNIASKGTRTKPTAAKQVCWGHCGKHCW